MPTFQHSFTPATAAPAGAVADLTVREIEDAGIREILQTPGAALGNWQILGALLDPSATSFRFLEPLGHAREVKTAVSGLFGRFVARAYATKYLGLTHFAHVRKPPMRLSGIMRGELDRVLGKSGDMPDWVAWGPAKGLAIVEAKGCHDTKSPAKALERAYKQACRAEVKVGTKLAPFKRYAIATRWGFRSPKLSEPMLWVHDPDEDGSITPDEMDALQVGITRRHIATLLKPLGFADLSDTLIRLSSVTIRSRRERIEAEAHALLQTLSGYRVEGAALGPQDMLIGGFVSRGGPLAGTVSPSDQAVLRRHELTPVFVGVEHRQIKLAIEGIVDPNIVKVADAPASRLMGDDGAGSWVLRIEDDATRIIPVAPLQS